MKTVDVSYLNEKHEKIVVKYIKNLKKYIYFSTENVERGKYQQFVDIMFSVYLYSNNFYSSVLERNDDDSGTIAEFLFLVPNMCFYSAIGFLTALKDGKNDSEMKDYLERVSIVSESATGELADILIDEQEKKEYIKELINIKTNQN